MWAIIYILDVLEESFSEWPQDSHTKGRVFLQIKWGVCSKVIKQLYFLKANFIY